MKEYSTWSSVFLGQIEPKSDRNEGILQMGESCLAQIGPKSNRNEGILHMGQSCSAQIGPKSNRNDGILHMEQCFFGSDWTLEW